MLVVADMYAEGIIGEEEKGTIIGMIGRGEVEGVVNTSRALEAEAEPDDADFGDGEGNKEIRKETEGGVSGAEGRGIGGDLFLDQNEEEEKEKNEEKSEGNHIVVAERFSLPDPDDEDSWVGIDSHNRDSDVEREACLEVESPIEFEEGLGEEEEAKLKDAIEEQRKGEDEGSEAVKEEEKAVKEEIPVKEKKEGASTDIVEHLEAVDGEFSGAISTFVNNDNIKKATDEGEKDKGRGWGAFVGGVAVGAGVILAAAVAGTKGEGGNKEERDVAEQQKKEATET